MPAIARADTPPRGLVPDKPPRDRLFASVQPSDLPDPRAIPSVPPAPTFAPPVSRAAEPPPTGRAAPATPPETRSPEPNRGRRSEDKPLPAAARKSSTRRRRSTMPPPGTVSALPPVSPSSVPGIEDPSRYEEITPMG